MTTPAITPDRALAVYGTLAPGESNHHVVADLGGEWVEGAIRGRRFTLPFRGGPHLPAFRTDPDGPVIPVVVLVSDDLALHWDRLDEFEGPDYHRVEVDVFDRSATKILGRAWVYESLIESPG